VCLDRLTEFSAGLQHIAFITVLLSDVALFPAVNTAYSSFFGTSPPARATLAVDLPSDTRIRLEVIACKDDGLESSSRRQALHVQGLSYWAPANIGPYSQAIRVSSPSLPCPCHAQSTPSRLTSASSSPARLGSSPARWRSPRRRHSRRRRRCASSTPAESSPRPAGVPALPTGRAASSLRSTG
jgi:hypothetical protein